MSIDNFESIFTSIDQRDLFGLEEAITSISNLNHLHIEKENTPLIYAIDKNWVEGVNLLVEAGADVNKDVHFEDNPLLSAINVDNIEIVQILLNHGANPNAPNCLKNLLCEAIRKEKFRIACLLLKSDINVNDFEDTGDTPLILASRKGNFNFVKVLIEAGANADIVNFEHRQTALFIAAIQGHQEIFDYLLPLTTNETQREYALEALPDGLLYKEELCDQKTQAFIQAATQRNIQQLKYFINRGVDIDKLSIKGENALHVASDRGYLEVVNFLIKAGANIDISSKAGYSPLHIAIRRDYVDIVKILIDSGASVIIEDGTLLFQAACFNSINSAKILIDIGLDINATNKEGLTALEVARACKSSEIVKIFEAVGAIGRHDIENGEIPF